METPADILGRFDHDRQLRHTLATIQVTRSIA
jgi:hypothetical protein